MPLFIIISTSKHLHQTISHQLFPNESPKSYTRVDSYLRSSVAPASVPAAAAATHVIRRAQGRFAAAAVAFIRAGAVAGAAGIRNAAAAAVGALAAAAAAAAGVARGLAAAGRGVRGRFLFFYVQLEGTKGVKTDESAVEVHLRLRCAISTP